MIDREPLDLPPPYTPSDNESQSSSQHNESSPVPPPPDYHTIHERPGYHATSSASSSSTSVPTTKERPNDSGSHSSGSSNTHPLLRNVSYDPSRGPIGSILDMASNIVENATLAANTALGAPPTNNPADLGNNLARSATTAANNASRAALELVEGFVNNRNERREDKRERRREKKRERIEQKQERKERREMKRSGPSCAYYNEGSSSTAPFGPHEKSPHQPYSGAQSSSYDGSERAEGERTSDYDCNTASHLLLKKSNSPLELNESWSGDSCSLKTTNGHLTVRGSLTATDSIELETTNGNVTVEGPLLATKTIKVKSTNGPFIVHGNQSIIGKHIDVSITNSPLQIDSIIQAKTITLKTKNSPVQLGNLSVGSSLNVKTSNSPIEIHIFEISNESARIEVETSNAPVSVFVPSTFSGYFLVKSNNAGSTNVVAKSTEQSMLNFETNDNAKKEGTCKNYGNNSKTEIIIKTTNAIATLYI